LSLDPKPEEDISVALTEVQFRAAACALRWFSAGDNLDDVCQNESSFRAWIAALPQRNDEPATPAPLSKDPERMDALAASPTFVAMAAQFERQAEQSKFAAMTPPRRA
jgi:hypothetical protein